MNNQNFPADREAETWVVGSAMLDPKILDDLGWLPAEDFYSDDLRQIYAAMVSMRSRGEPISIELIGRKFLGDGWLGRMAEIGYSVPTSLHCQTYAHIVAAKAQRRRLYEIAGQLSADACAVSDDPPFEALEAAETALAGLRMAGDRREPVTLAEAARAAQAKAEAIHANGCGLGVPTGLVGVDGDVGGLFPGELIILAARPGVGKTSLALQIAAHNASLGHLVYFASLEMGAVELSTRMACGDSGVSSCLVRVGSFGDNDLRRLSDSFAGQHGMAMEIHDQPALTAATIRREIRKRKKRGLLLAVVDYLQLITPADKRLPREQQVAGIVRTLKETAREYEIPILCLCQLNRQVGEDGKPALHQLRESGAIEQDADMVLMLSKHKPKKGTEDMHNAVLDVKKNRNGETGPHRLMWEAERTRFSCCGASIGNLIRNEVAKNGTDAAE